ncbi:sporulation initiation phosphotransferase B [Metabacillus halosaccharovorans]|uniref:Sporulation initiation phosphotransferase B n=1 Tax=Metabacillus halosaccharovorans TaxID=930124 RepID=A0ABT3DDS7_9BACI|nr:sporulation initiation phosphotransferase B [Metabacillus halosaccharovorans]MCV9885230.1 sporulation initiation phosphotransferase B [Metabacillus halosaccharovorans]
MENKQNEIDVVNILSHSRHDWMNKLQLIKGNLSLQKYDRVQEILEEIVIEAQQESKLCNLQLPLFASYLMTFNWSNHHFLLEYEVLGETRNISQYDKPITQWSKEFLEILDHIVDYSGENRVCITLHTGHTSGETVRFFFDFEGIIKEKEQVTTWLQNNDHNPVCIEDIEIGTYQITVTISLDDTRI